MRTDSHKCSSVDECSIIELPRRIGDNGNLTEVENTPACPFTIKRVYYLYDVPADSERGGHSHFQAESLLVAVSGSFEVVLDDGVKLKRFVLNRPYQALHLRKGIWRTLENFSSGSVCLVINSEKYEEDDYVRDYDEFLRLTACKKKGPRFPFLQLAATNQPYLSQLKDAACRVIESGQYIGGKEVEALETEIAKIACAKHAIGVSNGLDALRLILRAHIELGRLRPGDEVIVPADTFIATVLAITDSGLKPVFVDAELSSRNIDIDKVEQAITPATKAIMVVHLYGRACWNQKLADIATRHNLYVFEDNAQAFGALALAPGLNGTFATGGLGHAAGVSFYPTKNIGALGDAGAVTTNDDTLAATVRALRNYGTDRQYHNVYAGLNCRLDPIQAAMLRVKLPYLDKENAHRRAIAMAYSANITNPAVLLPAAPEENSNVPFNADLSHVWHQYVVLVENRDAFRKYLIDKGVETGIHYPIAPHQQPCYRQYSSLHLPVAEEIAAKAVSLPIGAGTSIDDAITISEIINAYAT